MGRVARALAWQFLITTIAAPASTVFQWPFDPSGYLFVKGTPRPGFEDLRYITIMRRYEKGGSLPVPGVYNAGGEVFAFTTLVTQLVSDIGTIEFRFTTARLKGVHYSFAGKFLNNTVFEEHVTDPEQVVAEGRLVKTRAGRVVAEAFVQLTYKPRLRGAEDINEPYPSGKTELMYAAIKGDAATVKELLGKGANPNARDRDGATALLHAVRRFTQGDEIARALIVGGADLNLATKDGETALMRATYTKGRLVEMLLSAGADPNRKANDGRTALIHAVQAAELGSVRNLAALIRAGADVNSRDKFGRTALSIASEQNYVEAVQALREAGARR
jgi:hypothetical protein